MEFKASPGPVPLFGKGSWSISCLGGPSLIRGYTQARAVEDVLWEVCEPDLCFQQLPGTGHQLWSGGRTRRSAAWIRDGRGSAHRAGRRRLSLQLLEERMP